MQPKAPPPRGFGAVPRTGVIYVMQEATARGFRAGDTEWSNLGQGAPETGTLPGAAARMTSIPVGVESSEYAPVGGLPRLREAVAELYNRRFRAGKPSQYGPENVSISAGGRAGLTRIAAALDRVNLGHFLPDYTAYEELLDLFRGFIPIPILNRDRLLPSPTQLREEIIGRGLGALLLSNPCNPTGDLVSGPALGEWVAAARELGCAMIFDEFYSHYIYGDESPAGVANSAAAHVNDVNQDPVLILDGLTKNWRYPGLRLCWTLGPAPAIEAITSAGSFLDGGASHPVQEAAVELLDPAGADREARAIQLEFAQKREYTIARVRDLGLRLETEPRGGFYCFASLEGLRPELRHGMQFFQAALERKVITVPGEFFDVNPGQRRSHLPSRLQGFVRLSFGPSMAEIKLGFDRLAALCSDGHR